MNIVYLKWLLNKCRYAAKNGSEEYMRERFIQLIGAVEQIIENNEESEQVEQLPMKQASIIQS